MNNKTHQGNVSTRLLQNFLNNDQYLDQHNKGSKYQYSLYGNHQQYTIDFFLTCEVKRERQR